MSKLGCLGWILGAVVESFDAIVLAGGRSRRLGGVDKAGLVVGGSTLLDGVIAACAGASRLVAVGPVRPTARAGIRWCRESPPGGGPVAALAAGLREVVAPLVAVLGCDLPYVDAAAVAELVEGASLGADGAIFVDGEGRDQPLAGTYRTAALVEAVRTATSPALRVLVERLDLRRIPDLRGVARDCDTWQEVEVARHAQRVGVGGVGGARGRARGRHQ